MSNMSIMSKISNVSKLYTDEASLIALLAKRFFLVVPQQYLTYCSLTAEVSRVVLQHFGLQAELVPCQLWCAQPNGRHAVVGFVGRGAQPGKWDGHVVCATEDHILDAALHHLERDFSIPSPMAVVVRRNRFASQSFAALTVAGCGNLLWLRPPPLDSLEIPLAPKDLVEDLAAQLIRDLRSLGAAA